jgi:hypothetical protein
MHFPTSQLNDWPIHVSLILLRLPVSTQTITIDFVNNYIENATAYPPAFMYVPYNCQKQLQIMYTILGGVLQLFQF